MSNLSNTVERINPVYFRSKEKYLLYLRHVFAYEYIASQVTKDHSILEIGFGEGFGTRILADAAGEVVALDVEESVVQYARERYGSPTCRFQRYDGRHLPFEEGTFDCVVSFQVIEHIQDDRHFLEEAHRVLKKGGSMWLTTPNRTHRVAPGAKIWNKFHVREYFPEELESLLEETFDDASVWGIRGTDEVQRIEYARVKRGLNPRKMIPERIRSWIDGNVRERYSTSDFSVDRARVSDSLDLLGVCRK